MAVDPTRDGSGPLAAAPPGAPPTSVRRESQAVVATAVANTTAFYAPDPETPA